MQRSTTLERAVWIALCFASGALLRAVPETLLPGIPVGFDTVTYLASTVHLWLKAGIGWTYAFQEGPIVYLLVYLPAFAGVDLFWVLKVLGPLFYGVFAIAAIVFIKEGFGLSWPHSFLGSLFVILQVANLRFGWDLWRNLLGLTLVLIMLAAWHHGRHLVQITIGLSVMTVLTNQFAAVTLFSSSAIALGLGALRHRTRAVGLALLPAFALFIANLYVVYFINAPIGRNVILALQVRGHLANYVLEFGSALNFWNSFLSFCTFALGLLPLLAVIGLNKEKLMAALCLPTLAFATWSPIFPTAGLPQWWRWVLDLGLPLSFYGFYAVLRIGGLGSQLLGRVDRLASWRPAIRTVIVVILILPLGVQAMNYVSSPPSQPAAAFVDPQWNIYVPKTLVGTSINPDDVPATLQALAWLTANAPSGSVVLVEERFMGWALLNLESDFIVVVYPVHSSLDDVLTVALPRADGKPIFLIWLSGRKVHSFVERQTYGNIAVFEYETSVADSMLGDLHVVDYQVRCPRKIVLPKGSSPLSYAFRQCIRI